MDNFLENTLSIVTQPKQNFHFRYVSELKNTHGVITGQQQELGGIPRTADNANAVIEDTYPTVRLKLPPGSHLDEYGNKRDFYVLCSLHSCNEDGTHSLSPHLLMAKGNQNPTYDFIFAPMEQNIENPLERIWQLKDYVIVRLTVEKYRESLLEKRKNCEKLKLPQAYDQLKGSLNLEQQASVKASGLLNVCLGFTVYEFDFYSNEYRLYKETIYSDNIFHGDDLRIHELCNTKGPIAGGTKVHILIKLPSGNKYDVHIFRYTSDRTSVDWEEFVPINNSHDIFSNAAVTFLLPPGPTTNINGDDEIEVLIEIVVNRTTYKSQGVKFWYLSNPEPESVRRKRPRQVEEVGALSVHPVITEVLEMPCLYDGLEFNLTENQQPTQSNVIYETTRIDSSLMTTSTSEYGDIEFGPETEALLGYRLQEPFPYYSSDHCETVSIQKEIKIKKESPAIELKSTRVQLIKQKIEQILSTESAAEANIRGLNDGNTIFHDALADTSKDDMEPLIFIYRQQNLNSNLRKLLLSARNCYRQNLLHYACILNKPYCIKPLIGIGVALHEQDSLGRTPLHIAIEQNYKECMQKIQNLLENHSEYPDELEKQLIKMFQVYSHRGHTVLHIAVIENQYQLLEIMLKFCKSHNLNIFEYETLGNGDSIAHLIVKRNLVDMVPLLKAYGPGYLGVTNYPGKTVLDITELSQEMLNALTDNNDEPDLSLNKLKL